MFVVINVQEQFGEEFLCLLKSSLFLKQDNNGKMNSFDISYILFLIPVIAILVVKQRGFRPECFLAELTRYVDVSHVL